MNLHGLKVLITGGGSGIGLELARLLAVDNEVAIAGRDTSRLERAAADEPTLRLVHLDVTSEASARAAVAAVVRELGGLDVLVNSAGVLHQVSRDDDGAAAAVDAEVAVNLIGPLRMTRLALPYLRRGSGAVVFLSSALALTAAPGLTSYAATKAGIHSAARSLRVELGGTVRVFDVLPPFVDTALARGFGGTKLPPRDVAIDVLEGLRRDRFEIRIGRVNGLAAIVRLWPSAADRIVARELVPAAGRPNGGT